MIPRHLARCALLYVLAAAVLQSQYRFDNWTTSAGLPQNSVVDILQTHDSYLWFTTSDGLVRFDGIKFTVFNRDNSPGMTSTRLTALYEDRNHDLWVGSEEDGLMRFRNGVFTAYGKESGLTRLSFQLHAIGSDASGALTVLQTEGVERLQRGHFELLSTGAFPNNPIVDVPLIKWGDPLAAWSQGKEGVAAYIDGKTHIWGRREGLPEIEILAVAEDEHGTVWMGGVGKLFRKEGACVRQVPLPSGCSSSQGFSFVKAPKLELVCRGPGASLLLGAPDGSAQEVMPKCPLPDSRLSDMRFYRDRENILWIGTSGNGLYSARRQAITMLSGAEGLRDHNIYPIYEDRSGVIWIGAWPQTLSRFDHGRLKHFSLEDGLSANVSALFQDRSGQLWIGAYSPVGDGLRTFENERFIRAPQALRNLGVVRAIFQDRSRALWFGCQDKLVQYQDGAAHFYTTKDGLATNFTTVLTEDHDGNLWIGGLGGLTRYDGQRFTAFTVRDGLPSATVRALYFDSQNVLWIGTYDVGLGRYDGSNFTRITMEHGLSSNGVFQILEDANGYLWMSSNQGIFRARKQDLNDFAAGKIDVVNSIAYAKRDGMLNEECNGGHWQAGIRARDGKLWFPTENGVAIVDPARVPVSKEAPSVSIESLSADFTRIPLSSTIRLNPAQRNFEIQYTALSLMAPERIRFRYRLEGVDSDWVNAGSRRTAYYSHVPHGDYHFKVIAANRDGVWNAEGSSIQIQVLPYFYETWWFYTSLVLACVGVLYLGWRRHMARLTATFASQQAFTRQLIARQESERQRIAAELHDSIGQRLAIIKNLITTFVSQERIEPAGSARLEEVTSESSQAMREIREIAYNLRPYQLDQLGLTKAIEAMLRRASQASGIAFSATLDNLDGLFPADSEISFYRIIQEAVNNILKHSSATQAQVTALVHDGRMNLRIHDNGKGFPQAFRIAEPFPDGFGLRGISERAGILSGQMSIESTPGNGTAVSIEFDLRQRKTSMRK